MPAADVLNYVTRRLPAGSIRQIDGKEMIGTGLCAVCFSSGTSPGQEETK